MTEIKNKYSVAIVYHYLAHYREPIFRELSSEPSSVDFTFLSDAQSNISSIQTIDPAKAGSTLKWSFLRNKWFFDKILWQCGLQRHCLSNKFDAIIFLGNAYFLSTWIGAALARISGKKVYMWTHGFLRDEQGFLAFIRTCFYRLAHGLFVYGNRAKNILIHKGFKDEEVHVLYNSLDFQQQKLIYSSLDKASLLQAKNGIFNNAELPTLLWIGRLLEDKRLHLIFEAVKRLSSAKVALNVLLIGDGPDRKRLENLVVELGLGDFVHFHGPCHDEVYLAPLISMSDLCVSPGPVGLTALHCMAYGVPVLTNDNMDSQKPEVEAIVPGVSGDFFKENDVDDLCLKIRKWVECSNRDQVVCDCQNIILAHWNPLFQKQVLESVLLREGGNGRN